MPEQLPTHIQDLVATTKQLAKDTLIPLDTAVREGTKNRAAARATVIAASKTAGLYRLTQPASVGGGQADTLTLVALYDEIASHNTQWFSACFGARPGVLADVGEPLKSQYLQPMLNGDKRSGFGFTESADAPYYTRAERDGAELVVNGHKSYVTRGDELDFINVLADIGDEGRAFVVIDTDAPGVSKDRTFESLDGSLHAAFRFDNVRIPAAQMVGEPGIGMSHAMHQIGNTRLIMAAEAVGLARWTLEFLAGILRANESRHGPKESIRLRYGELRIQAYVARSAVYRAARRADSGENAVNEGIAAKALATEALAKIVDEGIQLAGGGALLTDHPLARLYREVRVLRVAEGLTDILRQNIARGALELGKGTI